MTWGWGYGQNSGGEVRDMDGVQERQYGWGGGGILFEIEGQVWNLNLNWFI